MRRPQLIVVAGPNGVGKSTYSLSAFASGIVLVDPDQDRAEMERKTPLESGRVAVRRVRRALSNREDFVLETTLSGKSPMRVIEGAKHGGYDVTLLYIGVQDPDVCVRRVRHRVEQGGHDVPEADIRRRYVRSVTALPEAIALVDQVLLHDNSSEAPYRIVAHTDFRTVTVAQELPAWAETAVAAIRRRIKA